MLIWFEGVGVALAVVLVGLVLLVVGGLVVVVPPPPPPVPVPVGLNSLPWPPDVGVKLGIVVRTPVSLANSELK